MKKILIVNQDLEKLQQLQFDMFQELDTICTKHNLPYFLAYGSLLGAVRHQGFIPWDDDIDVMMMRGDYEKMLEIMPAELSDRLFLQSYKSDPEYPLHFSKIRMNGTVFQEGEFKHLNMHHGVYIDIFPIDNTYEGKIGQGLHRFRVRFFQRLVSYRLIKVIKNTNRFAIIKYLIKKFADEISKSYLDKRLHKACTMLKRENSKYLTLFFGTSKAFVVTRDAFFPVSKCIFNNMWAPVPANWDLHLETLYGNYMQPPLPEKRISHHDIIKIDLNNNL